MTEQTVKRGIAVFEAMNDLPASVILRAALPEESKTKPNEARASLWDRRKPQRKRKRRHR